MASGEISYKEDERRLIAASHLGPNMLFPTAFNGLEAVSAPFHFELDLLSPRLDIKAPEMLGKTITVSTPLGDGSTRVFNGYVVRWTPGRTAIRDMRAYGATLAPWLWFLGLSSDCRIFQHKTPLAILEEVFADYPLAVFETSGVKGEQAPLDYCVQYNETDLAFVTRLMEAAGIFYYFRHEAGRHTLVLGNQANAFSDVARKVKSPGGLDGPDRIDGWREAFDYGPSRWASRDYNYLTPSTDLSVKAQTKVDLPAKPDLELYSWPGLHDTRDKGDAQSKHHIEAWETGYADAEGESRAPDFFAGGRFELAGTESLPDSGTEWVLREVRHDAVDMSLFGGGTGDSGSDYRNSFVTFPAKVPFRPGARTPRPVVKGPQTAFVVGPAGKEIHTDELGRVMVQFHWDRYGDRKGSTACWVRVAQPWAGKGWGAVFIPRIGDEVVVSFLDGDPDRPLISGSVYNGERPPPYDLKDSQTTCSGIKTRSTKGGGAADFNELTFDDKAGKERIYLHAQKDMDRKVEHDDTITIDHDQTVKIGHDRTVTVTHNDTLTVSQGNQSITITMGKTTTEAFQSIELKVGTSSVMIDQSSITLKAMTITIEGEMMVKTKGMMVQSEADALMTIKGGLVTIN